MKKKLLYFVAHLKINVMKKYVIRTGKEILAICWSEEAAKQCYKELIRTYKNPQCIVYENKRIVGWFDENVYVMQQELFIKEV